MLDWNVGVRDAIGLWTVKLPTPKSMRLSQGAGKATALRKDLDHSGRLHSYENNTRRTCYTGKVVTVRIMENMRRVHTS
jgi:hypothetical protein